jgi:hypothetical protein
MLLMCHALLQATQNPAAVEAFLQDSFPQLPADREEWSALVPERPEAAHEWGQGMLGEGGAHEMYFQVGQDGEGEPPVSTFGQYVGSNLCWVWRLVCSWG